MPGKYALTALLPAFFLAGRHSLPMCLQVHMPALLSAADRPPGELLGELASLAAAHEVGMDMGRQGALVWRLERQPEDWQQLVGDMALRLEQVRWGHVLPVRSGRHVEQAGCVCITASWGCLVGLCIRVSWLDDVR